MRCLHLLAAATLAVPCLAQSDDCSSATPISGEGAFAFSTLGLTNIPGAPSCAGGSGSGDGWFEWTPVVSGNYLFSAVANFQAVFDVRPACGVGAIACGTAGGFLATDLVGGTPYLVQVNGFTASGGSGDLTLALVPGTVNDDCMDALALGTAPATVAIENLSFAPDTSDLCSPDTYGYWYRFVTGAGPGYALEVIGENFVSGLTLFDACGGNEVACSATGAGGILVTPGLTPSTEYWVRVTGSGGFGGTGALEVRESAPNDVCSNATVLTGNGPHLVSNLGAGTEGLSNPCGEFFFPRNDVWYSWTAPTTGPYTMAVCPGTFRVVMEVYPDCDSGPIGCGEDLENNCGGGPVFNDSIAKDINVFAGASYLIRIASTDYMAGNPGTATLNMFPTPPPADAVGTTYCTSTPNSSGEVANLRATRNVSLSTGPLRLATVDLPANAIGLHYFGTMGVNLPFGDGTRCVGGLTQRLPIQAIGMFGSMITTNVFAQAAGSAALVPGDLYFQCWYRDQAAQGAGFNLSNAQVVTVMP